MTATQFTVEPTAENSEFSILLHRQGHGVVVIASGLSASEAQHRIERIAQNCGQPVTAWTGPESDDPRVVDVAYVNESGAEGCGFYVLSEDLPEEEETAQ